MLSVTCNAENPRERSSMRACRSTLGPSRSLMTVESTRQSSSGASLGHHGSVSRNGLGRTAEVGLIRGWPIETRSRCVRRMMDSQRSMSMLGRLSVAWPMTVSSRPRTSSRDSLIDPKLRPGGSAGASSGH
jgi:hypothetical protein